MSGEKMKWGENKLIGEEAIAGAMIFAAAWLSLASALISNGEVVGVVNGTASIFDYVLVSLAGGGTVAAAAFGFWLLGWQQAEWHYDGMQLLERAAGVAAMQDNEDKLKSTAQKAGDVPGIVIAGVELSRTREVGHISMFGLPGSGKTVLINNILHQVMQRNEKVIIHDPKGDFTSWTYGSDAVLLGPWDERAVCWDIARDLRTAELATTFAGALVGDAGGDNKFFTDAARELIAGLLKLYIRKMGDQWSWDTFAEDLSIGGNELVMRAQLGDPNLKTMIKIDEKGELSKTAQSVMSNVGTAISWVIAYAGAFDIKRDADGRLIRDGNSMFSIQGWLAGREHQDIKKVLLNNNKNYESRAQQIFGAIVASAANYINSSEMPEVSADNSGLWLVLDEYVQLGGAASLYVQQIEELGRSRGVRVLKATQDESQLFAAVGREKGEAQRSVQQTRIYAKLATGSASELSQKLGQREIMRVEFPLVVGAGNKRAVKDRAPILRVEDLTGLRVVLEGDAKGVEIVIHTDDVLVKLVQPFLSRALTQEKHEKVIDSKKWERGVLEYAERAEAAAGGEIAIKKTEKLGQQLDDDDNPFSLLDEILKGDNEQEQ